MEWVKFLTAAAGVFCLCGILWLASANRLGSDPTLMLYLGWIVDQGAVPYRDLFDVHPPGAFFTYLAVGRLTNYSDVNGQAFGLAWLAANTVALGLLLRRFGIAVAIIGACAAAIAIVPFTLQRAVFLLPVLTATLWLLAARQPRRFEAVLIGAGFGLAVTIRPQLGIGLVPIAVFLWRHRTSRRDGWLHLAALSAGCAVPLLVAGVYLVLTGAADPFWSIVSGYWPLYAQLPVEESLAIRAKRGAYEWLPLLLGVCLAGWSLGRPSARPTAHHRLHGLLVGLALAYFAYVPFTANFLDYHWLLFFWCAWPAVVIGASQQRPGAWRLGEAATMAAVAAMMWSSQIQNRGGISAGVGPMSPVLRQADALTAYLDQLPAETSIQAIDWVNGSARAMLNARREPATSFVYTSPLWHDTETSYTGTLRDRFISEFDTAEPDVVLQFKELRQQFFPGEAPFLRLRERLRTEYQPAFETEEFIVHERLDDGSVE